MNRATPADQLRRQLLGDALHVVGELERGRAVELVAEADRGQRMGDRAAAVQHRHGHDRDAGDVVAAIDAEALAPCDVDFLAPALVVRRVVPAQAVKAFLDLGPGLLGEGREAASGGADQGGEAAADIDMQAHRRLASAPAPPRSCGRGPAAPRRSPSRRSASTARRACGRTRLGKSPFSSTARASGSMPTPRLYCLVSGSTLHQLLGHQRAQDVQRRARHQVRAPARSPSSPAACGCG